MKNWPCLQYFQFPIVQWDTTIFGVNFAFTKIWAITRPIQAYHWSRKLFKIKFSIILVHTINFCPTPLAALICNQKQNISQWTKYSRNWVWKQYMYCLGDKCADPTEICMLSTDTPRHTWEPPKVRGGKVLINKLQLGKKFEIFLQANHWVDCSVTLHRRKKLQYKLNFRLDKAYDHLHDVVWQLYDNKRK